MSDEKPGRLGLGTVIEIVRGDGGLTDITEDVAGVDWRRDYPAMLHPVKDITLSGTFVCRPSFLGQPVALEGVRIGTITAETPEGFTVQPTCTPAEVDRAFARMRRRWAREGSAYWKRRIRMSRHTRHVRRAR